MNKFFYGRVSSLDRASKGLSIHAQIERAEQLGIPKKNIYVDAGKSASVKEDDIEYALTSNRFFTTRTDLNARPEFQKLLLLLKDGDEVVYTKHDRISRNIVFMNNFINYCERKNVTLTCLDESQDRLTRSILVVISEEELHKTTSRNEAIQESLYKQGIHPYRCPYGYKKIEGQIIPIPEQVALIRQIYALHDTGTIMQRISEQTKIHASQVKAILSHKRFYQGYITYKGQERKGTHEAIL